MKLLMIPLRMGNVAGGDIAYYTAGFPILALGPCVLRNGFIVFWGSNLLFSPPVHALNHECSRVWLDHKWNSWVVMLILSRFDCEPDPTWVNETCVLKGLTLNRHDYEHDSRGLKETCELKSKAYFEPAWWWIRVTFLNWISEEPAWLRSVKTTLD